MRSLRHQRGTRTVYLPMKTFAIAALCVLLAGCATPLPSSTASPSPTLTTSAAPTATPVPATPSPSPSVGIAFTCSGLPAKGAGSPPASPILDCPAAEAAVLVALASLGYPVQSVTIRPYGFTCGDPFGSGKMACLYITRGPVAYVRFVGTNKVAALIIGTERGGPVIAATVEAFEVPPPGWSMP